MVRRNVIPSPSLVILSEAKDPYYCRSGVNFARNLALSTGYLRDSSGRNGPLTTDNRQKRLTQTQGKTYAAFLRRQIPRPAAPRASRPRVAGSGESVVWPVKICLPGTVSS